MTSYRSARSDLNAVPRFDFKSHLRSASLGYLFGGHGAIVDAFDLGEDVDGRNSIDHAVNDVSSTASGGKGLDRRPALTDEEGGNENGEKDDEEVAGSILLWNQRGTIPE